jgi:hypothetical protein
MTKITVDKEFRSLWASKLPLRQIAERYGVNPSWDQKADYITYRQAGYSIEEAATKATAAKVKIRATPKVMA